MYLIGNKGVKIAINREVSMTTIINQLPDLTDQQLAMLADYIWGLKTAECFLNRT